MPGVRLDEKNKRLLAVLPVAVALVALLGGCSAQRGTAPAPVMSFGGHVQSHNGGVIVKEGDTVWRVAQRYGLPVRDVVDANRLPPPYTLSPGQRLVLPVPRLHKVGRDDTLYAVSRMYGVPVSELARDNRLQPPYLLKVGQVLRIPSKVFSSNVAYTSSPPVKTISAEDSRGFAQMLQRISGDREGGGNLVKQPVAIRAASAANRVPSFKPVVTTVSTPSGRNGFVWPVRGKVISAYGPKQGGLYNDGINIAAPRSAPVAAASDGVVAYVGNSLQSYGNLVLIRHKSGMVTAYAHLHNVSVRQGMTVVRGQAIGTVGSTGSVSSAQLHFEIRRGAETINPMKYLG